MLYREKAFDIFDLKMCHEDKEVLGRQANFTERGPVISELTKQLTGIQDHSCLYAVTINVVRATVDI